MEVFVAGMAEDGNILGQFGSESLVGTVVCFDLVRAIAELAAFTDSPFG